MMDYCQAQISPQFQFEQAQTGRLYCSHVRNPNALICLPTCIWPLSCYIFNSCCFYDKTICHQYRHTFTLQIFGTIKRRVSVFLQLKLWIPSTASDPVPSTLSLITCHQLWTKLIQLLFLSVIKHIKLQESKLACTIFTYQEYIEAQYQH